MRLRITHVVVSSMHWLLVYDLCCHCSNGGYIADLFSGSKLVQFLVFWMLVVMSSVLYLATALADPGFMPLPGGSANPAEGTTGARLLENEASASVMVRGVELQPVRNEVRLAKVSPRSAAYVFNDGVGEQADAIAAFRNGRVNSGAAFALSAAAAFAAAAVAGASRRQEASDEREGMAFRALQDGPEAESSQTASASSTALTSLEDSADRVCKICRVPLPLRAKHCEDCGRCVRTHDHHCPWVANCVGENNRVFFFWFVTFQAIEACWVLQQGGECVSRGPETPLSLLFGLVIVLIFAIALVSLVICHLWLMAANLTTWEYLRWRRISYLRELTPEGGSPFSASLLRNFMVYCCPGKAGILERFARAAAARCPGSGARGLDACLGCLQPEGKGGGRMSCSGVTWQLGSQHIPCILNNRVYSCYFPPLPTDLQP